VITADGKTEISEPVPGEPSRTRRGYAIYDDPEAVNIRDFRLDDYDAVLELWGEAGLPFRPGGRDARAKVAAELVKDTAVFIVAEEQGRLVGVVFGTRDGRKGWINRLAVVPSSRQRGVAARLVAEVEARLEARGLEVVAALIEEGNEGSMHFFERLGYVFHHDIHYFSKMKTPDS
jgi:ribosomal protein S18 acetylase RimI-like enzyme